jgi:hypothetical protein
MGLPYTKNLAEAAGHYTRPTVVLNTLTFLLWTASWQSWQAFSMPAANSKAMAIHSSTD